MLDFAFKISNKLEAVGQAIGATFTSPLTRGDKTVVKIAAFAALILGAGAITVAAGHATFSAAIFAEISAAPLNFLSPEFVGVLGGTFLLFSALLILRLACASEAVLVLDEIDGEVPSVWSETRSREVQQLNEKYAALEQEKVDESIVEPSPDSLTMNLVRMVIDLNREIQYRDENPGEKNDEIFSSFTTEALRGQEITMRKMAQARLNSQECYGWRYVAELQSKLQQATIVQPTDKEAVDVSVEVPCGEEWIKLSPFGKTIESEKPF